MVDLSIATWKLPEGTEGTKMSRFETRKTSIGDLQDPIDGGTVPYFWPDFVVIFPLKTSIYQNSQRHGVYPLKKKRQLMILVYAKRSIMARNL